MDQICRSCANIKKEVVALGQLLLFFNSIEFLYLNQLRGQGPTLWGYFIFVYNGFGLGGDCRHNRLSVVKYDFRGELDMSFKDLDGKIAVAVKNGIC